MKTFGNVLNITLTPEEMHRMRKCDLIKIRFTTTTGNTSEDIWFQKY